MLERPLQELSSWTSLPMTLSSIGPAACTMPKSPRSGICVLSPKFCYAAINSKICFLIRDKLHCLQWHCACCGAVRSSLIAGKALQCCVHWCCKHFWTANFWAILAVWRSPTMFLLPVSQITIYTLSWEYPLSIFLQVQASQLFFVRATLHAHLRSTRTLKPQPLTLWQGRHLTCQLATFCRPQASVMSMTLF